MLKHYVEALNSPGGVPEVGSTWERVLNSTYSTAVTNAVMVYKEKMQFLESQLPLEVDGLMAAHSEAHSSALKQFKEDVQLDSEQSLYEEHITKLQVSRYVYVCNYMRSIDIILFLIRWSLQHFQLALESAMVEF